MLVPFVVKALRVERGDIVLIETSERLTEQQFNMFRDEFARAKAEDLLPAGVHFMVLDRPLDVSAMHERHQRHLLEELCAALNMRAVPTWEGE